MEVMCVKHFMIRILKSIIGLMVFAFGEYLTIQAGIGLSPWSCLSMGVSYHLPFSYGTVHVCISLVIVLADVLLGEKIGFSTLMNAVLIGTCVDVYTALGLVPQANGLLWGVLCMCIGMLVTEYGQYLYMKTGMGCGPRDSLLVALGKRVRKVPIGAVQIVILACALAVGALLGGPIGIGTVLSTFGIGIAMQLVFGIVHFEPRDVVHEDCLQTLRAIK